MCVCVCVHENIRLLQYMIDECKIESLKRHVLGRMCEYLLFTPEVSGSVRVSACHRAGEFVVKTFC